MAVAQVSACGKTSFGSPVAALEAMHGINRKRARRGQDQLRGIYQCPDCETIHLTRGPGNRPLMAEAVNVLIERARQQHEEARRAV